MTLFIIHGQLRNTVTHCVNCGDPLDQYEEPEFPCDECTACQPMNGWYGSWPKISENDPRYKDIPLSPDCYDNPDEEVTS